MGKHGYKIRYLFGLIFKKNNEEKKLKHPAIFPSMLASRIIECFSHKDDIVLDPFAGTGSTLIAAKNNNRFSYGIELSDKFNSVYVQRKDGNTLFQDLDYDPIFINDDARNLKEHINSEIINLTITSPPYWDILNRKRTADGKDEENYSDYNKDLGNVESYKDFLKNLKTIFSSVYDCTVKEGYCCVILMDIRKRDQFYPFHIDTISFMQEIGFTLDDIIIWDRRQEYNNLRPLGYPYVFRVNKVHEYILIFQKR